MKRLRSLCNRLRRQGVYAVVNKFGRGIYALHWSVGASGYGCSIYFGSVRECEEFLIGLWR